MSIEVDRETCIGSGQCVMYAEQTFTQDDEAKVVVLDPPADSLDTIRVAVDACPTRSIHLIGGDGE